MGKNKYGYQIHTNMLSTKPTGFLLKFIIMVVLKRVLWQALGLVVLLETAEFSMTSNVL